ncbi:MAG: PorP/SprF family type IX secretion system membrane protein [Saprospiraceae bacterium]|nr:PorP/SprF family type IX secretion system membrane protein [Saprospiraceae bacterium]
MKSIQILILINICCFSALQAQQLPYLSQLGEARTFWNPAATATGTTMNIDVFVRQQWLGFKGAPTTGFLNYQMPFVDYNMSAGGALVFDKTGPVSKIGLQLNYAYKLIDALGDDSQLSLGITAGGQNYSHNTTNAIVNQTDDPRWAKQEVPVFSLPWAPGFITFRTTGLIGQTILFYRLFLSPGI